jgi:hypothetical protein
MFRNALKRFIDTFASEYGIEAHGGKRIEKLTEEEMPQLAAVQRYYYQSSRHLFYQHHHRELGPCGKGSAEGRYTCTETSTQTRTRR